LTVKGSDLDIGRAVNPPAAEAYIEGGMGQGIGYALCEQLHRREDGTWVDNFTEYLLPTAFDTPNMGAELIKYPEASGPFGEKGSGEQVTVAAASAFVDATAKATGVRVTRLPVEPRDLVTPATQLE
jgi:CO/xanthine dehydrogenase Mo-binding subunit